MYSKSCNTWIEFSLLLGASPSAKDVSRGRLSACLWNEEQVNSVVWIACLVAHMFRSKKVVVSIVAPTKGRGGDALFLDLPLSKRKITGKRARTFS